jgi:hypothetical protein
VGLEKTEVGSPFFWIPMDEPANGYSIDELHAYAKANDFAEEAAVLSRYVELQRRTRRRARLVRMWRVVAPLRGAHRSDDEARIDW